MFLNFIINCMYCLFFGLWRIEEVGLVFVIVILVGEFLVIVILLVMYLNNVNLV